MVKKPPSSKSSKPPPRASKSGAEPSPAEPSAVEPISAEEIKAQQRLLNVFSDTFRPILSDDENFAAVLQKVKQALYNRDFEAAFGNELFLEVYAARWSPPRALCYAAVEFGRVSPTVEIEQPVPSSSATTTPTTTLKMLAIGGGAAEIVAFAEFLRGAGDTVSGDLTLLDTGPWGKVIEKLHAGLTTAPPLSKYASAAAKAANAALVAPAERLRSTFVQQDALQLDNHKLAGLLGRNGPVLVTLLFTLNELYTSGGIKMTTAFLRTLSSVIPVGSLLLVVDSPGSYSEAAVGKEAKRYPMQWLLDHTLLQADKLPPEGCRWEKIQSHDSIWFRLGEGLRYPMDLQDMRYQMHLYRASSPPSSD
ncbi:hypothetical protein F4774DRAFT_420921 [Daldinia eschscholtzii]|nr:hypothetical protein F4774DRAFT_420921 [Daldinia eschscholtzii]